MRTRHIGILIALCSGCLGSGSSGFGGEHDDGGPDADSDSDSDTEPEIRLAPEIGIGDHSAASVNLVPILVTLHYPTGIGFPSNAPGDLWIVNRDDDSWTLVEDVAGAANEVRRYDDSSHFLNSPSSLTFSADEPIAGTCNENANDLNGLQSPDGWMGPVAWTTEAAGFSGGSASHYDMAHEENWCMGIAWSEAHVFWTFNGNAGALDRVDFHDWHPDGIAGSGLGGEDHADGEIFRYAAGELQRVQDVPSHMVFEPVGNHVYVNDTGNHRIVRIDATPVDGTPMLGNFTEMPMYRCDTPIEEVVAPGELTMPSGLALHTGETGTFLYVTDFADGTIKAFTLEGELVNWVETGASQLTGIALSGEGVVYVLDAGTDRLYRVEPVVPPET